MNSEQLARIINSLEPVLTYNYMDNPLRWFYSFGTLLYLIRDKNWGKDFNTDFDVSILDGEEIDADYFISNMESFGFGLKKKIINNHNKKPLQLVFESNHVDLKGVGVDIFFWIKGGNYYWHTFDRKLEFPKNGIPTEYFFKATPALAFKGEPYKHVWEEIAVPVNIPRQYGTLLDIWYPGWLIPDKNFGYSKCVKEVKLDNCNKLKEKLI